MAEQVNTDHVHIDSVPDVCGGRPVIKGTRMTVSTLVQYYQNGMTIDEILDAFSFLTPAQLHDALAYYYDHQKEIDEEIALSRDEEYWKKKYPPGKLSPSGRKK
jgi:uncharacterized protein (DUF433 family)